MAKSTLLCLNYLGYLQLTLILVGCGAVLVYADGDDSLSRQKIAEAERKIQRITRHALKTIQSEDGDIIDCIDIKKQPAFDQPALKDHKIQMAPSTYDLGEAEEEDIDEVASRTTSTSHSQVWHKSGSCPVGTIPVRRMRMKELLKGSSVKDYGRKKTNLSHQVKPLDRNQNTNSQLGIGNHSKSILMAVGFRFLGGKGDIKVYNPFVEFDDEYSTSQVALINGPYFHFDRVECGWAVNPSVYGDRQSRLFVYWTADSSKTTGCFDLTCPGFVQINHEIALGAAISPISLPGGLPYEIIVYIYKDPVTSNWWVRYGERINIGYWPPELFNALGQHAESVEWGGEVYSTRVGQSPHTSTQMGSGAFSDPIFKFSGFIKRMRINDNSPALKFPELVRPFADEFDCYDFDFLGDYIADPEFYYGGPGNNWRCP